MVDYLRDAMKSVIRDYFETESGYEVIPYWDDFEVRVPRARISDRRSIEFDVVLDKEIIVN